MVEGMLGRIDRRDVLAITALGLIGAGTPLWLSAAAGAIGVPSNDDWVYMRGAESLFRTGSIDMPGRTAAAIGQVVLVQPLLWLSGGDPWVFTAFGLVMALIGLASSYLLARCFLGTGSAAMVALLLVAFPGFARESATFMTDVPAFALAQLCLLLGTRWLQGGRRVTLVASIAAGLLGVSIREFAIAAPLAILVAAWARNRADERAWLAGLSGIFTAGVAWVLVVAGSTSARGGPLSAGQVIALGSLCATFAAVLLPAAALAVGRRMATFSPAHILLGAVLACIAAVQPDGPLIGNLWMPDGLGGNLFLSGTRNSVIGAGAWALSELLALFAAVLVAALALRWSQRNLARVTSLPTARARAIRIARSREAPLVIFLVVYGGAVAFLSALGYPLDRYLFPMVPAAAILLLRRLDQLSYPGRSRAFSHAAFAWLVASAFVIAANSFAYDAARWRAGEVAVAMGYDARTVDAGYEWVGYFSSGSGNPSSGSYGAAWYDDIFMSSRPCAVFSNSPLDGGAFRLIRVDESAYLQYLFFGPAESLYLYGSLADGCPLPPAAAEETVP
jgi:hypothetical protein